MGAAAKKRLVVAGSKGGEAKQKQPSIATNGVPSLSTARILYMWSWGPIVGPVNGLNSVKLDGTPVVAADGTVNYPGFKWQFRSGELNQARLEGNTESSNEIAVAQELRSAVPYLYTISNAVVDAVRIRFSWPQLQSQDSSGNINGVAISYAVDISTDNGPFLEVLASSVDRKNVTKYERSHRIELPAGSRWTVRARRITPEANSSLVQDGMVVEAIAEVVDSDQEYPLTAVSMVEYDAQLFGGDIAKIAVLMRGRIVRVPSNYDAVNRTYATAGAGTSNGVWDGTFKEAYTNNPAWVFYDLVLHPYYGLGERIDATMVDRWSLYRIAQYCDQSVPDGKGGQQPRFTCNLYLQKQAEAYAVLQDMASIFNGMAFWDGSQIVVNADMPGDPVFSYNQSMILNDGEIRYSGIRWRDRHTTAMVAWDNPDQDFETDHEPVFDEEAIAELGQVRELTVDAFGCTSLGQAQRAGQWALMTEQLQTRTATMKVGLEGQIPRPGQVIAIADPMLSGRANGGRIAAVAGRVITLDRDADIPTGARLLVNLPSGRTEARVVRSFSGRAVTVMADYTEAPVPEAGWALDYDDLQVMQFYVRNITRPEWHQFQFEMIQHEPAKFPAIDSGAVVDPRPISVLPIGVQEAPARVLLSEHVVIEQGIAVTMMTIAWDAAPGAVAYDVEWRWGAREWVKVPRTAELAVDVRGIYSGQYMARVRAVSALNVSSVPTTSQLTNLAGKVGLPPAITSITTESLLFGIGVHWTFPPGAEDTQRTELWYSPGTDVTAATKLSDLAYPQSDYVLQNLRAGAAFFFWARLVDRTGNIGPFYPVGAGVRGEASSDAGAILDQIAGEISESELGKELAERIDLIDGAGPGSVNERVQEAKDLLAEQIAAVDGDLAATKAQLQEQIDSIADLADSMPYKPDQTYTAGQGVLGEDGIIYQASKAVPVGTPPPNTEYWLNVGQAVATANGLAARVQTVETKVTSVEGVNTAQAQQITGLRTDVDGKASASSVQSIGNRVTANENSLSSQGSAITGLDNKLTVTNGNVTAAQTAANNAATLAGSKGKVLVQTTAPVAADQLAQNLWIDITGGANTPKRWNGSAWAAVTDKVATDAAAAAANALAVANTKADVSTVQSLRNDVTQLGTDLTAAGTAITAINANLSGVGGENLLFNPSFDREGTLQPGVADGWFKQGPNVAQSTVSLVASYWKPNGKAQRIESSTLSTSQYTEVVTAGGKRPAVKAGDIFTMSVMARGTAGARMEYYFVLVNAAGNTTVGTVSGSTTLTPEGKRVTLTGTMPAGSGLCSIFLRLIGTASITSAFMEVDDCQMERGSIASGWRDNGQSNATDIATQAAATSALSGRVSQTETGLTSVSGQLTLLNNSIGTMAGDNLLANSSFEQLPSGVTNRPLYWRVGATNTATNPVLTFVDSPLASSLKAVRLERAALPVNGYIDLNWNPADGDRPKVLEGQSYTLSVYARLSSTAARFAMYIQWMSAGGTVVSTSQLPESQVGTTFTRMSFTATAPVGSVTANLYAGRLLNRSGATADMWIELDNVQLQEGATLTAYSASVQAVASEQAATSAAMDSLSSTVSQQGTTLTSVGARTTTLENAVYSTSNGLATKASATAVDTIANRVTAAEDGITASASAVTGLTAAIKAANAAGANVVSNATFDPAYNQMGFTVVSTATAGVPTGCPFKYAARLAGRDHTPAVTSVPFVATKPGEVWRLSALVACASGAALFNHYVQRGSDPVTVLATGSGGGAQAATSAWTRVTWDYTVPANTYFVRPFLQVNQSAASPTTVWYATDWHMENVSAAKAAQTTADATASALTTTQATVSQQGTNLTAVGRRVDTIQASLGDTNASVQQVSQAQAAADSRASATYAVKLNVSSNGQYYVAGFGLGLENNNGTFQSSFVVAADRFAVLNAAGGLAVSPFAVINGQTFIADAFIRTATITELLRASQIESTAYNNYGQPMMTFSMGGAAIIMRHATRANTYKISDPTSDRWVIDGVVRVRIGSW